MSAIKVDVSVLSELIKKVAKSGGKLDQNLHDASVGALGALRDGEGVEYLDAIVGAMNKGGNRGLLLSWVKAYAPVKFVKKTQKFRVKKGADVSAIDADAASGDPFWNYVAPQKAAAPFDPNTFVARVRRKLAKADERGELRPEHLATLGEGLAAVIDEFVLAKTGAAERVVA